MEDKRAKISQKLNQEKDKRNMSARQFAAFLGVSSTSVLGYLNGLVYPSPEMRHRIAIKLGLTPEEMDVDLGEILKLKVRPIDEVKKDIRQCSDADFLELADVFWERLRTLAAKQLTQ